MVAEERAAAKRPPANLFQAAVAGAFGGVVAGLAGGIPYFLEYRDELASWRKIAGIFFTYVMLTGAAYAAGARAGVAAFDRLRGMRASTAIIGGLVGATLIGPVPGAIGVGYFGSQPYVFMGTAMFALAPVAGAWLTSAWIALADRRAAGLAPTVVAMLLSSFATTALFGAIGAAIYFSVDDEVMLAWFRSGAHATGSGDAPIAGLAFVGVEAGALLGIFVGGHLGATLAIARSLVRPKRG